MWVSLFLYCQSSRSTVATAAASELTENTFSNHCGGLEMGEKTACSRLDIATITANPATIR